MKRILMLLVCVALVAGCATRGFPPTAAINNFDHVDKYVCRGAQPNAIGIEFLARVQHVTLVINLRNKGDTWDREMPLCLSEGMKYAWVPLPGASAPSKEQEALVQALIEMERANGGKVFIHCQHGCDRTGTAVACYEINHGVKNDVALREAKFYGLSPFEPGMIEFIKKYKPEDALTPLNAPSTERRSGKSL